MCPSDEDVEDNRGWCVAQHSLVLGDIHLHFRNIFVLEPGRKTFAGEPWQKPGRLVYMGLRIVDPGRKRILEEIKASSSVKVAFRHVKRNTTYLSFGVDALDLSSASSEGAKLSRPCQSRHPPVARAV